MAKVFIEQPLAFPGSAKYPDTAVYDMQLCLYMKALTNLKSPTQDVIFTW
jgi:hypothetical protein